MNSALDRRLVQIVPSGRQLRHQELEFYSFIHFTVNTFTGKEWGDGTESPALFNPRRLDADQWASAIREAGMRGMILTCKAALIPYYERFGYRNKGISASVHGGAVWYDMVLKFGR